MNFFKAQENRGEGVVGINIDCGRAALISVHSFKHQEWLGNKESIIASLIAMIHLEESVPLQSEFFSESLVLNMKCLKPKQAVKFSHVFYSRPVFEH